MALDATGMESRQGQQLNLGEEPIYCAAYDDGEEVLCHGSDEDLSLPERVAQRLRYEDQALRYLRGRRPMLLSAALRGPFDRASGWQNPWLLASQEKQPAACSAVQTSILAVAVPKAISRVHAGESGTSARQTPATDDSVLCHLPSPDSQREVEVVKDLHLDTEAQSRIRLWARNVPETLDRDEFWAPEDSTAEASDESAIPKRPAGKEWLKSKLHKRRRTETISFETAPTPTPVHLLNTGNQTLAETAPKRLGETPGIQSAASQSFEQTTPASSSEQRIAGDVANYVRSNKSQSGKARSKVARGRRTTVGACVAAKPTKNRQRQAPRSIGLEQSFEKSSDLPSQQLRQVESASPEPAATTSNNHDIMQDVPLSNNDSTEAVPVPANRKINELRQPPPELGKISFESHVDQSFQYKARAVKRSTGKLSDLDTSGNLSQLTQTGTPLSDAHDESTVVQVQMLGNDDSAVSMLPGPEEDIAEPTRISSSSPPCFAESRRDKDTSGVASEISEKGETNDIGNVDELPDSKMDNVCDGTTIFGGGLALSNSHHGCTEPLEALKPSCGDEQMSRAREEIAQSATQAPQASTHNAMLDAMLGEDSTLIGDAIDMDSSTPLQMNMPAERLEAVKFSIPVATSWDEVRDPGSPDGQQSTCTSNTSSSVPGDDQQTGPGASNIIELTKDATAVPSQAAQSGSPATTKAKTLAPGHDSPQELANQASSNRNSEHGSPIILVPLSQAADWAVVGSEDGPLRLSESHLGSPEITTLNIGGMDEFPEHNTATSQDTTPLQSPWAPLDPKFEIDLVKEQQPESSPRSPSNPNSLIGAMPITIPPSQQEPWIQATIEALHPIPSETLPIPGSLSFVAEQQVECRSVPSRNDTVAEVDLEQASSLQDLHSRMSHHNTPNPGSTSSRPASAKADIAIHTSESHLHASQSRGFTVPITPTQQDVRRSTPEPNLSIKSFANFNTPSPKRRRSTKQTTSSGDRLTSNQTLVDAGNGNPWSSSRRSSLRSRMHSRSSLRVSFAPLPGVDSEAVELCFESKPTHPAFGRRASPPPLSSGDIGDEDIAAGHFHKHFDAMMKTGASRGTPRLRPVARLLPSESQQKPMSPEIGMMAQAFREADERRALRSSPEPEIAVDAEASTLANDRQDSSQSPWLADNQSQGFDDVSAVLHNLDDFLNPRWDVEAEMDKAKAADGIENQKREPSPDLLGHNIWAL